MLYLRARYVSPEVGRFLSPDTIIPDFWNPRYLNRYSYALNNPQRYVDPSGNDPIDEEWEQAFIDAHGRRPTDQDRRDRFFSLLFPGSGLGKVWTENDWVFYHYNRSDLWAGGDVTWPGAMEPGLDRFIVHLERLASYYKPGEEMFYAQAIGFIWGGVPLGRAESAAFQMATNPGAAWAQNIPLFEGIANCDPRLVDDENPSHHYAGLFYMGYFFGPVIGHVSNWLRDGPLSDLSMPDLLLGRIGVDHGAMLFDDTISMNEVGVAVRYALDVRPGIWPSDTPGSRVPWHYYFPPHPH